MPKYKYKMEKTQENSYHTNRELFNVASNKEDQNEELSKNIIFELLAQAQKGAGKLSASY